MCMLLINMSACTDNHNNFITFVVVGGDRLQCDMFGTTEIPRTPLQSMSSDNSCLKVIAELIPTVL